MKVLANGGLNVSELDGWWAEAHVPEVGWAIGDGKEHGEDPAWDTAEVEQLYTLLEQQIVPEFYDRGAQGLPSRWLERVRESMARLTPEFSASRAIREYTNNHYLPAAAGYEERAARDGELGADLVEWQHSLADQWKTLRFGKLTSEIKDGQHRFQVQVVPGDLHADQFRVELYAAPTNASGPNPEVIPACDSSADPSGTLLYSICCPATRPAEDYTARVVPSHPGALVPLEASQILWQR
jgi:starch phosphorylase